MTLEVNRIGTERCMQSMGLLAKIHLIDDPGDEASGKGWVVNPPFQRGSVWTLEQKQAWIKSILMGFGLPAIFVNRFPREHPVYGWKEIVIDGQQRLRATAGFMQNDFEVEGELFSQQSTTFRRVFTYSGGLAPVVYCAYKTDRQCAELYLRLLSAGTAHTELEIAKAENYIKTCEE